MTNSTPDKQKFSTLDEKRDYLEMAACEQTVERLPKSLPCAVTNCLNVATIGSMSYDLTKGAWMTEPLCRTCTDAMTKAYRDEEVFSVDVDGAQERDG